MNEDTSIVLDATAAGPNSSPVDNDTDADADTLTVTAVEQSSRRDRLAEFRHDHLHADKQPLR